MNTLDRIPQHEHDSLARAAASLEGGSIQEKITRLLNLKSAAMDYLCQQRELALERAQVLEATMARLTRTSVELADCLRDADQGRPYGERSQL
jgi:hypothetical protein